MQGATASIDRAAAASLISWWRDAGVDSLVDEAPRDWLAKLNPLPTGERDGRASGQGEGQRVGAQGDCPSPRLAARDIPLPGGERVELPSTLDALLAWMRDGDDVPEARWGRTRLLPSGDPGAGLMILTDMPEPGDAEAGLLMAGDLGALFDKMLVAIGRTRASIWLAPLATIRSVGRITPDAVQRLAEIARHHVGLVAPKRLLIMGEQPNRALIGTDWQNQRGTLHRIALGDVTVEAVSTFHPRLLNDRPTYKAQAWKDLQLLMKGL